jgi:fibronectin-binding autotransporter adhesin
MPRCRPTATVRFAFLPAGVTRFFCVLLLSLVAAAPRIQAAPWTWNGAGGNTNWSTGGNWSIGSAPTSAPSTDLYFGGNTNTGTALAPLNQNIATPFQLNSLQFSVGAGNFFLGGNALAFTGAGNTITQASNLAQSIANNINAVTNSMVTLTLTGAGSGVVTLSGAITPGNGNRDYAISKTNTSTFILSGANNYGGATTISGGVLNIQNASALGSIASGTTVFSGAALQIQGGIAVGNEPLILNGSGLASDGALRNISGNNSYAGGTTLGSASTIASDSGTLTLTGGIVDSGFTATFAGSGDTTSTGVISGTGALVKNGNGTLTLNATNTYSGGTTINGGTVAVISSGLGAAGGSVTINAGTLEILTTFATPRNFSLGSSTSTFQIDPSQTYTVTGTVSGTGSLNKTGTGTLILSGANTYTGATNVSAGTLQTSANERIANTSDLNVSGGTFALQSFSETVASVTLTSGSITGTSTGTLTASSYSLESGNVSAVLAGTGPMTKSTTGTVTLTGINTFTGTTTVTGGTLVLAAGGTSAALGSTSSVQVNAGGTLLLGANDQIKDTAPVILAGGTFAKGDFHEGAIDTAGVGALSLTASGSQIDFGTGTTGILSFASFNPVSGPNTFTLTIANWTGMVNSPGNGLSDRLIFVSDPSAYLSSVSFDGYAPGAVEFLLPSGLYEVVPAAPVPEPSTWVAAVLALGAIAFCRCRRVAAKKFPGITDYRVLTEEKV